eukprot:22212-Pyramimonas_sp.AAC.1
MLLGWGASSPLSPPEAATPFAFETLERPDERELRIFGLPSGDRFPRWVYTASSPAIGSHAGSTTQQGDGAAVMVESVRRAYHNHEKYSVDLLAIVHPE